MMISSRTFSSEDTEIVTRVEQNYQHIQLAVNNAALLAKRDPGEIVVVAVSKTVDTSEIQDAIAAGIHDFGENRSKPFSEKLLAFPEERWHFIGHIQTNKLKDIVGKAHLIHSVATERALLAIDKLAQNQQIRQQVLIEVNVSGEASKDGVSATELPSLLEKASKLLHLEVKGLMTMAPILQGKQDDTARNTFATLRKLRDNLVPDFADADNISLNELSMGMSDDFEDAIQEGATIVRIGRRLWS